MREIKVGDIVTIKEGRNHCRDLNPEGNIKIKVIAISKNSLSFIGLYNHNTYTYCINEIIAIKEKEKFNPSKREKNEEER